MRTLHTGRNPRSRPTTSLAIEALGIAASFAQY